jgi:type I restriction enzyme, R subunit
MVALEDVIAQINDLFSGDHPDTSVRNVVTHIKDRLEESETLQQQAQQSPEPRAPFKTGPTLCGQAKWCFFARSYTTEDWSNPRDRRLELTVRRYHVAAVARRRPGRPRA